MPKRYLKLITEWHLLNSNTAQSFYRAEVLQPDMTPYTAGGAPAVF